MLVTKHIFFGHLNPVKILTFISVQNKHTTLTEVFFREGNFSSVICNLMFGTFLARD
jgi:hypothetical protein